jgi:hypothetical protein
VSHRSLLNGDDEPKTLPYAITLNCPTGADAGQLGVKYGGCSSVSDFHSPKPLVFLSSVSVVLGCSTVNS